MVIQRPTPVGAILVVGAMAASIAMLVAALVGDGKGDAEAAVDRRYVGVHRVAWLAVCVMALVGASWLFAAPRERGSDATPYHNDAIALNDCAARLALDGQDPYTDLDLYTCYARLGIGADRTTPLRRGLFAADGNYPSDAELDTVWAIRSHDRSTQL